MSVSQFADFLVKQGAEKPPAEATEAVEEVVPEAVEGETTEQVESTEAATEEGDKSEGKEQPEDKPKPEDEEVLSKLNPIQKDRIQKRIDKAVLAEKAAEGKAALLEARIKELEAKASEAPPPPPPEFIAIPQGDPGNLTVTAKTPADLDKLEQDAKSVLQTYEDNEDAITRAIARDEDTVSIGGQDIAVAKLRTMKKLAERHIREHIPAAHKFIKERTDAVVLAKKEFPALFDTRTAEYQELQWVTKTYPQLRGVPSLEYFVGFALEGMAARKAKAEADKAKPAKTAANTPPKSAADSAATTAQTKPRGTVTADKAKLNAELDKADKEFDRTGSSEAYQKVLILKDRLKKLN